MTENEELNIQHFMNVTLVGKVCDPIFESYTQELIYILNIPIYVEQSDGRRNFITVKMLPEIATQIPNFKKPNKGDTIAVKGELIMWDNNIKNGPLQMSVWVKNIEKHIIRIKECSKIS